MTDKDPSEAVAEPANELLAGAGIRPAQLLGTRRFGPFFATQFLGAFNDNVFKNALIIMITFGLADAVATNSLVNMAAGLFILPFFLFSALAGQLADRIDKAACMRAVKLAEIAIMIAGAAGFLFGSIPLLMVVLFLMGTQSTFFGPAKYAILPQHLPTRELTTGNALVSLGTFLAILLGTIGGGLLISIDDFGPTLVAAAVVAVAVAGYLSSRRIPPAPAERADLAFNFNLAGETFALVRHLGTNRTIALSVLGISWFWFLGTVYLTQFPNYTRTVLGGDATVATLLLALFSVGIGAGSLICEKLSRGRIESGLVPIGAIGMTVFGIRLGVHEPASPAQLVDAAAYLADTANWTTIADLVAISLFAGLYIVPLSTLVQHLSTPEHRARVIAANNILNALFMVGAAVVAIVVLGSGHSIPELFLYVALFNVAVAVFIFGQAPEFLFRMLGWLLVHTAYRIRKQGLENIPVEGPAVLVSNHVSFVDAVILHAICPRRTRFVMHAEIYRLPVLNWLFRAVGAIPVSDPRVDRAMARRSYDLVAEALESGEVVAIFPEGHITRDGQIGKFKNGIEKIVRRSPAPVVPIALSGLWGSFFSYAGGPAMRKWSARPFARVDVIAGPQVPPEAVRAADLERRVAALRGPVR